MGGEAAAAEVAGVGRVEGGLVDHRLDVGLGDLPPGLDGRVAVGVLGRKRAVQRGGARVAQVDDAAGGAPLGAVTGDALDRVGAPVGAHVGEDLRPVGQQVVEHHGGAVEVVVLRRHQAGAARAVPVEGRVDERLHEVAVGQVVGPLALALEARDERAVAGGLLLESQFGEPRVALHEVAPDEHHLGDVGPPLLVLLRGAPGRLVVEVLALDEVGADPGVGQLEVLRVVDAERDPALDLHHVDVLVAHAQVVVPELLLDHAAGDAHGDAADGQVGPALHQSDGEAGGRVVQQALADGVGDGVVVGVLDLLAVDAEGGDAELRVAGERRGQVDRAGALGAVEAPDGVRHGAVHVDGLCAVAPAGGDAQRQADVLGLELRGGGLGLGRAADGGVGDDHLDGAAVGVAELGLVQRGDALGHVHRLVLEALADAAAPAVDDGPDADLRVVGHGEEHLLCLRALSSWGYASSGTARMGRCRRR